MTEALTVLAIKASLLTGYWLYQRFGSGGADAAYDAIATASSVMWILAGIFSIMGGFVVIGGLIIVVFSYIAFSKGTATKQRVRQAIAG